MWEHVGGELDTAHGCVTLPRMKRGGVLAGVAAVVVATSLTGCESRPYPDWCRDLDSWRSSVYPRAVAAGMEISPEQRLDLISALQAHEDAVAEYPELASAFGALITWWENPPSGAGLAERRAVEQDVWNEFEGAHEACPGPYY